MFGTKNTVFVSFHWNFICLIQNSCFCTFCITNSIFVKKTRKDYSKHNFVITPTFLSCWDAKTEFRTLSEQLRTPNSEHFPNKQNRREVLTKWSPKAIPNKLRTLFKIAFPNSCQKSKFHVFLHCLCFVPKKLMFIVFLTKTSKFDIFCLKINKTYVFIHFCIKTSKNNIFA